MATGVADLQTVETGVLTGFAIFVAADPAGFAARAPGEGLAAAAVGEFVLMVGVAAGATVRGVVAALGAVATEGLIGAAAVVGAGVVFTTEGVVLTAALAVVVAVGAGLATLAVAEDDVGGALISLMLEFVEALGALAGFASVVGAALTSLIPVGAGAAGFAVEAGLAAVEVEAAVTLTAALGVTLAGFRAATTPAGFEGVTLDGFAVTVAVVPAGLTAVTEVDFATAGLVADFVPVAVAVAAFAAFALAALSTLAGATRGAGAGGGVTVATNDAVSPSSSGIMGYPASAGLAHTNNAAMRSVALAMKNVRPAPAEPSCVLGRMSIGAPSLLLVAGRLARPGCRRGRSRRCAGRRGRRRRGLCHRRGEAVGRGGELGDGRRSVVVLRSWS